MHVPSVLISLAFAASLVGCTTSSPPPASSTPAPAAAAPAAAPPPPAAAPTPTPPAPPAPFPETISRAGERLLADALAAVGTGPRDLVIDPLIDANTGAQTGGTVAMGQQIASLVRAKAPSWNVRP